METDKINHMKNTILRHYFFSKCQMFRKVSLFSIKCGCEVRTKMFVDMMQSFVDIMEIEVHQLIDDCARDCKTCKDGCPSCKFYFNRTNEFFTRVLEHIKKHWGNIGIPQKAVDVFIEWYSDSVKEIEEHTRLIFSSGTHSNGLSRLNSFLNQLSLAMSFCINDLRREIEFINGRLDGEVYNGQTISGVKKNHH